MAKKIILQFSYAIIPATLFYVLYRTVSIFVAIAVAAALSLGIIAYHLLRKQRVTVTQYLGLAYVVLSFAAVFLSGNENLYYLPSILNNSVMAVVTVIMTTRGQSILHFVLRDFGVDWLEGSDPADYMQLNYIWIGLVVTKVLVKTLGVLLLDFDALYWLAFIFGDPAIIVYLLYCVWFVRKKRRQAALAVEQKNEYQEEYAE